MFGDGSGVFGTMIGVTGSEKTGGGVTFGLFIGMTGILGDGVVDGVFGTGTDSSFFVIAGDDGVSGRAKTDSGDCITILSLIFSGAIGIFLYTMPIAPTKRAKRAQ